MMNLLEKINERLHSALPKRVIASLLVAAECFSVVAVGVPTTYAQEDEGIVVVDGSDAYAPDWDADAGGELELLPGQEEAVTPAEAAELGANAAEQAAYEAELASYDAAMAAYDAEVSAEDYAVAAEAAARTDEAVQRAREAADRAADEAAWALDAYHLAEQEAQEAAEAASRAFYASDFAAQALENALREKENRDSEQSGKKTDAGTDDKNGDKTLKTPEGTALPERTAKPGPSPDKEPSDRSLKSDGDKSGKPANKSEDASDEKTRAEAEQAELDRLTEQSEILAAEASEKAASAAHADEEAQRAWEAADRAAAAANRAAAAVDSACEASARAWAAAERAAAYEAERDAAAQSVEKPENTEPGEGESPDASGADGELAYRELNYADAAVMVTGEAPEGVEVRTEDVSGAYGDFDPDAFSGAGVSDMETFASDESEYLRSEDPSYTVLAAYDIALSLNGEDYQPEDGRPLAVSITLPEIPKGTELRLWHIRGDGRLEQIRDFTREGNTLSFEAAGFSVYVVTQVTITTHITAGDGNTYRVSVTYDQDAAMPEDAVLAVRELGDDEKEGYVNQSAEALGTAAEDFAFARAFDIAILDPDTGAELRPASGVKVSISLLDTDLSAAESLNLLHFGEEVEKVDYTLSGGAVAFETDGFSVYVLCGYTVDFHWGDYTYSIAGESEITLSALLENLGVEEITAADVAEVAFSDPALVEVEAIKDEAEQTTDWLLRSLAPFSTDETLTLTLKNGQSVEIRVTDASIVASGSWPNTQASTGSGTWKLDSDGVLWVYATVSGDMGNTSYDYSKYASDYWGSGFNKSQVKHVVIGDGITGLANRLFNGYSYLETVKLGKDLTSLSSKTFLDCKKLTEVDFTGCTQLVKMGNSGVFQNCIALTSVKGFDSCAGSLMYFGTDDGDNTFNNSRITEIDLSGFTALTKIGKNCFNNCTKLTEVNLSGCTQLSKIESTAFNGCTAVTSLDISNTPLITSMDSFAYLTGLTDITAENSGLTTADFSKFTSLQTLDVSGSANLTSLKNIPASVVSLDVSGCTNLTSLSVPSGVTTLDISGCTGLTTLDLSGYTDLTTLDVSGCTNLTSLILPDGVTTLNVSGCTKLENLSVPNSVTTLTLTGCTGLTELDVSGCTGLSALDVSDLENLTTLDVSGCTGLSGLDVSDLENLTTLNISTCADLAALDVSGCTGLSALDLTGLEALTELDASGCTGLSALDVTGLEALTTLDVSGCTGLESLSVPNGITTLNVSGCTGLTGLDLASRTDLTDLDVSGCTGLTALDISGCAGIDALDLSTCAALATLAVGNRDDLTDLDWLTLPDSLAALDASGFTSLTSVAVPASATNLKLSGCTGLTALDLSAYSALTNLDMSDNANLTALKLPANVSALNVSGCPNLTVYTDGTAESLRDLIPDTVPVVAWGDYACTVVRKGSVELSDIFEDCGITSITSDDVESLSSSDTAYLEVSGLTVNVLKPFRDAKKLNVHLKNGLGGAITLSCEPLEESDDLRLFLDGDTTFRYEGAEETYPLSQNAILSPGELVHLNLSFSEVPEEEEGERQMKLLAPMSYTFPAGLAVVEGTIPDTVEISVPSGEDILVLTASVTLSTSETGEQSITVQLDDGDQADAVAAYGEVSFSVPVTVQPDTLPAVYKLSDSLQLKAEKPHNVKVASLASAYDEESGVIRYTVTVEAESDLDFDGNEYRVVIADLTAGDASELSFVSGSYTYAHKSGFDPALATPSEVDGAPVSLATDTSFGGFPLTVCHMYDGDIITLSYTAAALKGTYIGSGQALVQNTVTIVSSDADGNPNPSDRPEDNTATDDGVTVPYAALTREYIKLDGSWAYWQVTVNPGAYTLNGGKSLTLADTFDDKFPDAEHPTDAGQSIDYDSIKVVSGGAVSYDYSSSTGTFVIPDNTPVTITYRTRITSQPGASENFRGTARLKNSDGTVIASDTAGAIDEKAVIYPSASDVGGFGSNFMVKLYVYAEGQMQTGIPGAQFILLDANQRAQEYKVGDNKGQPVTFTTGEDGYVNIELHEEPGDVEIQKNTGYYLEMIQTVEGYQKDNTLYSFMITDDPSYSSGGFYKYYNGDTMKVRLYPASAGLSVSVRFSGSYALRDDQKNDVVVILSKLDSAYNWVEVERHSYAEEQWGSIKFDEVLYDPNATKQSTYCVFETNESPWDLPEEINLVTTYYCLVNTGESDKYPEPQSFKVSGPDDSVSVVIDNRYEEPQLTLVKMDKLSGEVLPGAVFSVYEIVNGGPSGAAIKEYTTDKNGKLVIRGGDPFVSERLYGIKETATPTDYLMPLEDEWHYFYFCNDVYLKPSILANLPEGATAINLTENGDKLTVDNQKTVVTIPVMKLWQGKKEWPTNTDVKIGLYRSIKGVVEEEAVTHSDGTPRTLVLNSGMPYNNRTFVNLPSRDEQNRNITYSIKEESISDGYDEKTPLDAGYVQEYGISSAGVYIVRNKPAVSLTVSKTWRDVDDQVLNPEIPADKALIDAQSSVTFDVYRSSAPFVDETPDNGITNEEMTAFVSSLTKVRERLSFGASDGWSTTIRDLDRQDDLDEPYYYYVLETVPSFGSELYEIEADGSITINNKIAPQTVTLTVTKNALMDDPRVEALENRFEFTLKLSKGSHPIRSWQVATGTVIPGILLATETDWNGEVRFLLKPTNPDPALQPTPGASVTLSLPMGVTASVTEKANSEYTVEATATVSGETGDNGRTFTYETGSETADVSVGYTNTLHVVCKVIETEDDGTEKQVPFESLKSALAYMRSKPAEHFASPWTIYLLEDYTIPSTDVFDVREGEQVILTTAMTTDLLFPFKPGEEAVRAVITRGGVGSSMLTNAGTLTLENICLDGGGIKAAGDGGLVNSTGLLNLNDGTTLRNSAVAGRGGAIYAEGTVNIVNGVAVTGNSAPSASALYLRGTLNMNGGSITNNTGAADGAVVVKSAEDEINLSGSPVIIGNTNTQGRAAANLCIGVDSDNVVNVVSPGLDESAEIGVTPAEGHTLIGEQFATAEYEQTAHLNCFINDQYGYRGKLKDGTSTNVIWNGLILTIHNVVDPVGANARDRFTITISSQSIIMSTYTIDGTINYEVVPARQTRPGRITLRNVKADDVITISPLPVGSYTIEEADSNYAVSYTLSETGSLATPTSLPDGSFDATDDCTVIATNIRRLADVNLTKTLEDRLKAADETQDFPFTVTLTEADGEKKVSGFTLTTDTSVASSSGFTTDADGQVSFTMSPTKSTPTVLRFKAPVGATLSIAETNNPNYRVTASGLTMPKEGEGKAITDEAADANVFTFAVTDDGADVTFDNVRKMAEIELRKELVNKVSAVERSTFTVTLKTGDTPVAGYTMYKAADPSEEDIITDENGRATIAFAFRKNESSKAIILSIPEGTRLEVAETVVKKEINGTQQEIYNTTYSINGASAVSGTTAVIANVSEDGSIVFTNTRKTSTITVSNTVSGYSGNVVPFTFTATVTDLSESGDDYDSFDFEDGVISFELTSGQSRAITVPYGAQLTIAETYIVGYKTTIKRGSTTMTNQLTDTFQVNNNLTTAFTNAQLIGLQIVNHTTSTLTNVKVTVGYGTEIYRVNETQTGQKKINVDSEKEATLSVDGGKTAILEILHKTGVTDEQDYTVEGVTPAVGYYYTIYNEPSFHEFADPAILRVYNADEYEVKGRLRYSVTDSIVTFTEQPLVSFDVNGGAWTTEMDGYHWDNAQGLYQKAVDSGEKVSAPLPAPIYTGADNVSLAGWTKDKAFARTTHTAQEDFTGHLYDFNTPVTGPFTLYAVWKNGVAVTYDFGGGIWTETDERFVPVDEDSYRLLVETGKTAARPSDPTAPAGYALLGWTADENKAGTVDTPEGIALARAALYDFSSAVTADLTLYAVYARTVTVTFDLSKSEGVYHSWTATDTDFTTADGGHSYTAAVIVGDLARQPSDPAWAGEGSNPFLKWTGDPGYRASAVSYENMDDVTGFDFDEPVTESVTLYTSWIDAVKLDVTVAKLVDNPMDADKAFSFRYSVDGGAEKPFTLKAGEARVFSVYATRTNLGTYIAQTLSVAENVGDGYSATLVRTLTGSGAAFSGGTIGSDASYVISAVQSDGTRWDEDEKGVTVTFTNHNTQETHTVTLENYVSGGSDDFGYTVKLTNGGTSVKGYALDEEGLITDDAGEAVFTLTGSASKALTVPSGTSLAIRLTSSAFSSAVSSADYEDADSDALSFTVDGVDKDGKVTFTSGLCKITDGAGSLLYDESGKPAVYMSLADAFTAYPGALYSEAAHTNAATPTAVKMLVDEYTVLEATSIEFPNKTMTLTTAGKNDQDFPYVGVRDRATIYRSEAGAGAKWFTQTGGNITLTEIILDGGSEKGVRIAKGANGGLLFINGGTLTVEAGTTLRNCEYADYSDDNNSRGGAINIKKGTLNVKAGLFTNLHARKGGAIYADGSSTVLNLTGTNGSTRFENCDSEISGGAIYYNATGNLTIDGGNDNGFKVDAEGKTLFDSDHKKIEVHNPGITFRTCVAKDSGTGNGGAIYISSNGVAVIRGCSFTECSAKVNINDNRQNGGGAIAANNINTLTVSNCTFDSCDTLTTGGALFARIKDGTSLTVNNSIFRNDSCKGQGGGVGVYQWTEKARSTALLTINGCSFENCSSGTQNGSGGSIQSYLPCMSLTNSDFTDCWAGKEGGAINHFYEASFDTIWSEAYLKVTGCEFTRCRAEDRYQPNYAQHYGGAINTKAYTTTITDSRFTDCVSTLREGGALHIGGRNNGSSATILRSTFTNCMAKTGGGAVMASTDTLEVSDSFFYGCQAFGQPGSSYQYQNADKKLQNGGGAVSHSENSRNRSTQSKTTIRNCVFSADPEGGTDALSCSTATNGGAIWTRATTVTIEGCTINGCSASGNGGAVYLNKASSSAAAISGGSITGCQAVNGSAVYVEDSATFSGDLAITENTVTDVNDGAIHGGTLYFEGNVQVCDNACSSDSVNKHDVLMQNDNVTTIQTTKNGLDVDAKIGVYVPDQNSRYTKYGLEGQAFGTYNNSTSAGSNYLESFFNDREEELYGIQMSPSDSKIYWGIFVCKITDAEGNTLKRQNGRDAVYHRLSMAIDEFTEVTGGTPVYVKMLLEDYKIRESGAISNFPAANITLTTETYTGKTAVEGKYDGKYPYRGTVGTNCTIFRDSSDTSEPKELFLLDTPGATFRLQDVTLDGRGNKTGSTGSFRLIEAKQGELVINSGATLQYGRAATNGGAILATGAPVTVNGSCVNGKATVKFTACTAAGNGGAICADSLTVTAGGAQTDEYGASFVDCGAASGGAVCVSGDTMDISGAQFLRCTGTGEGGAVFHSKSDAESGAIRSSVFTSCSAQASGGAVSSKAGTLAVTASTFDACSARQNGGAVNHSADDDRVMTTFTDVKFLNCKTETTGSGYGFGGSVYTGATAVKITGGSFRNSTAYNHGGALYCASADAAATLSGVSFEACSTKGNGGAIASNGGTLTLRDRTSPTRRSTSVNDCAAEGDGSLGGAVWMAYVSGSANAISITDNTVISGCYAKQGGAVYLPTGVTLTLTESPEFSGNGFRTYNDTVQNAAEGACIYLSEGARINLSGSPRFSRNILPNRARITNGGIYDNVRQDVFMEGYASNNIEDTNADSICVTGELTGDTIWIWPEKDPHRLPNRQFAKVAEGVTVSDASLSCLRNSMDDIDTTCSSGEYLAGVQIDGDSRNVYWDKMYVVSFRKIDNKGVAVADAEFTLFKDIECTKPVTTVHSADGENDTGAQGTFLDKGVVEFTSVRIGAYYMKETKVPTSFKPNNATYLVLAGTPFLSPNDGNKSLWENGGPLDVTNAATLVARYTIDSGKYFGIFPLDDSRKAILRANIASANVGISNTRSDYEAWFMKTDDGGAPLPNAAFTIYTPALDKDGHTEYSADNFPVLVRWSRDGVSYPDPYRAADGSASFKKLDDSTVDKGVVYFRELPIGEFYLVETDYPSRNGDNRLTYYVEGDRVFRMTLTLDDEGRYDFTLDEWDPATGEFDACAVADGYYDESGRYVSYSADGSAFYVVKNREAVCKLTDGNGNLLYEKGGLTLDREDVYHPAIYATLEEGFTAAQTKDLYYSNGSVAADTDRNPAIKLQALKDFTISQPVTVSSVRPLTFTTASRNATAGDRYIFSTTRTSDMSRAEIKRGYSEDTSGENSNSGALIQVTQGASLTLQNINLNGQKNLYNGRAIHVVNNDEEGTDGSLTILNNAMIQNFRHEAGTDSLRDVKGGAVLLDHDTTLTVDGGAANRSAEFKNNELINNCTNETGAGADGGAVAVGLDCLVNLTNAQFNYNTVTAAREGKGNGGAVSMNKMRDYVQANLPLKNVVFRYNSASYNGGALRTAEYCNLTIDTSIFEYNTANTAGSETKPGEGGAIAALSDQDLECRLTVTGGTFTGNKAPGSSGGAIKMGGYGTLILRDDEKMVLTMSQNEATRGGAVYAAPNATITIESGTIRDNSVVENGGALYADDNASVTIVSGTIRDNSAGNSGGALCAGGNSSITVEGGTVSGNTANLGSAVYVDDNAHVAVSGGTITGNKVKSIAGGAINVGGTNARLSFSGSPIVFDNQSVTDPDNPNKDKEEYQRNVVLDQNLDVIINTDGTGLDENALIGVYVTGEVYENPFWLHGRPDMSFGTFGDVGRLNPRVFRNDRNLALYGVDKGAEDGLIYWNDVICKLTDDDDNLLYRNIKVTFNGTTIYRKSPAVFVTIQEGLDTAQGELFTKNGVIYTAFTGGSLKLKMLKDAELKDGLVYEKKGNTNRSVTFTTAETEMSQPMKNRGDYFLFKTDRDDHGGKALITRAFEGGSLITANGKNLTLADITLDGNKAAYSAKGSGGVVYVGSGGKLTVADGASLHNSLAGGSGGAVYVAGTGAMAVTGGAITGNSAANGGAVYAAANGTVMLTGGTITGNTSTGDGAGVYLAQGSKLELSGDPDFGGTDTEADGTINGTAGNFAGAITGTNGGKACGRARQDVFIAGYGGNTAASVVVTGDITSGDGTIWVWAQESPHYLRDEQFAALKEGVSVSAASLQAFRNARPDSLTDNKLNSYLFGSQRGGMVYWVDPIVRVCVWDESLTEEQQSWTYYEYLQYNEEARAQGAFDAANALSGDVVVETLFETHERYTMEGGFTFDGTDMTGLTLRTTQDSAWNDGFTSTIRRGYNGESMLTVANGRPFTLENIILDGGSVAETGSSTTYACTGDGGVLHVTDGAAAIGDGVVIHYSTARNGGAVYVAPGASLTMTGGAISGNAAQSGGAVYAAANGAVTLTGGAITGNTCTGSGAGVYLAQGSALKLSGNPDFGGTGTDDAGNILNRDQNNGNLKTGVLTSVTNGGKAYGSARQDVYLDGTGAPLASIVITGALTDPADSADPMPAGSIWVWADSVNHYEMLRQFAVFDTGVRAALEAADAANNTTGLDDTMKAFRNAQPDSLTNCGGDYLTGQRGDVQNHIYWTGGFDVVFLKTDGFGKPLPGATFTLYTDAACTAEFQMTFTGSTPATDDGKRAATTSSDGTRTYKDKNGQTVTLKEGEVLLSKVAPKTYYLKETSTPNGFVLDPTVYQVTVSGTGGLEMRRKSSASAATFDTEVFKVRTRAATGTEPAEYQYRIMNTSTFERKVILRKTDGSYTALANTKFRIFRADLSEYTEDRPAGQSYYESGPSGAYFIGRLPYGRYYLLETEGRGAGKVFILTVNGPDAMKKELGKSANDSETLLVSGGNAVVFGGETSDARVTAMRNWLRDNSASS